MNYLEKDRKNFWIVLFIYISIFINSYVLFKQPFEFYIGYIIFAFLLPGFIMRFGINSNLFIIFLILVLNGIVNIFLGNDDTTQFIKVFLGLVLSYFFYYYVVLELDYNVEQLFKWYLLGAYIVCLIGLFQFASFMVGFQSGYKLFHIFNKWSYSPGGLFGLRINSVFAEPTHLGAVISAAFFVALYNLISANPFYYSRFQSVIVILVYFLSFSGLGQIGVFLSMLFLALSYGFIRYIILLIPAVLYLFKFLYENVIDFRQRLDGLVNMFSGGKFELGETHGSSFILYNNYTVALHNFKTNPILGTGIGSHPVAFEKYSLARDFMVEGINSNGQDANSMFLRLMSETGLFGIIIFVVIMIKCYVKRNKYKPTYHWLISNGILIMILLNLFRQGHYFLNGFPFFVMLYYFNAVSYKEYLAQEEKKEEMEQQTVSIVNDDTIS